MTNEELIKTLNLRFTSGNTTSVRDIRLTKEEYEQLLVVSNLNHSKILTCIYCGHEYPQDTPSHGNSVLTEHIKVCEKHPIKKLYDALVGMVGTSDLTTLKVMLQLAEHQDDKAIVIGIKTLIDYNINVL